MPGWISGHSKQLLPETLPSALTLYTVAWIAVMAIAIAMSGINAWQSSPAWPPDRALQNR